MWPVGGPSSGPPGAGPVSFGLSGVLPRIPGSHRTVDGSIIFRVWGSRRLDARNDSTEAPRGRVNSRCTQKDAQRQSPLPLHREGVQRQPPSFRCAERGRNGNPPPLPLRRKGGFTRVLRGMCTPLERKAQKAPPERKTQRYGGGAKVTGRASDRNGIGNPWDRPNLTGSGATPRPNLTGSGAAPWGLPELMVAQGLGMVYTS